MQVLMSLREKEKRRESKSCKYNLKIETSGYKSTYYEQKGGIIAKLRTNITKSYQGLITAEFIQILHL